MSDRRKFSNVIITDDNFDDELDLLFEKTGVRFTTPPDSEHWQEIDFEETLPEGFSFQDVEPFPFYSCTKFYSTPSAGGNGLATEKGKIAYEYGNGFMILDIHPVTHTAQGWGWDEYVKSIQS